MNLKSKVIARWEKNLKKAKNRQWPITGPMYCAYCREYINQLCDGCPIATVTGQRLCRETPYTQIVEAIREIKSYPFSLDVGKYWNSLSEAIELELEFLHSLPED